MSWNFDEGQDKANFTKFSVGVTNIRVLDKEPHMRWTHWLPQFNKSVNCPGRGCPICEIRKQQKANKENYTYGMGRRITINIFNQDADRVEIMEQGKTFFEDVRDIRNDLLEKKKDLTDVVLKVRRRGTGKDDTSYRIDIENEEPLNEKETEALEHVVNMPEYFKPHTNEQILQLLQVKADSKEAYDEAWNKIMTVEEEQQQEEDFEVR